MLTPEQYSKIINSTKYREWRDKHIESRCRWCGSDKCLDLHHIRYNYDDPDEAIYDEGNVITLCRQCHQCISNIKDTIQRNNGLIKCQIQEFASKKYNRLIMDEIKKLANLKKSQSAGFITFNDKSPECLCMLDHDIKQTIDGQIIGKLAFIDTGSLSWVSHYLLENGGLK